MPFQHIYTSAQYLIDTNASGFGTVARTRSLPLSLSQRLEQFSRFLVQAAQEDAEPIFTYKIIENEGSYYHVISRTVSCGKTDDGSPNYLTHHLVCTTQEVRGLLRHPSRPTPAGLALALSAADFWKNKWDAAPTILLDVFSFSARYLPDPSQQATWQDLTGHKRNARILSSPRYAQGCLILLPDTCDFSIKLMLNNESDWLSHNQGWGKTFTTHLSSSDTLADFTRIYTRKSTADKLFVKNCNRSVIDINENLLYEDEEQPKQTQSAKPVSDFVSKSSPNAPQEDALPEVPRLKYRRKVKRQRLYACIIGGLMFIGACALLARTYIEEPEIAPTPKSSVSVPHQANRDSEQPTDETPRQDVVSPASETISETPTQQGTPPSVTKLPDKQTDAENQTSQSNQDITLPNSAQEQPQPSADHQSALAPLRSTSTSILIWEDKTSETLRATIDKADKTTSHPNWDWIDLTNGNLTSHLRADNQSESNVPQTGDSLLPKTDKGNDADSPSDRQSQIVLSVTVPDENNNTVGKRFIVIPKIKTDICVRNMPQLPSPRFKNNENAQSPSRNGKSGYYRFSAQQIFSEEDLRVPVQFISQEPLTLPLIPDRDADAPNTVLTNEIALPEGWAATLLPSTNDVHTAQYILSAEQTIDLTPQAEALIERVLNKTRKDRDNAPSASLAYICRMLWLIDTAQDSAATIKYLKLFLNRDGKTRRYLQSLIKGNKAVNAHIVPDSRSVKNKTARTRIVNELKKPHAVSELLRALRHDMQIQLEEEFIKSAKAQNIQLPAPLELESVQIEDNRLIWNFRQAKN